MGVQGSVKKCECTLGQICDESSCQLNRHSVVTYIIIKMYSESRLMLSPVNVIIRLM
jgi:hypothetical protein